MLKWLKRKFLYDEMEDMRAFYEKFGEAMGVTPGDIIDLPRMRWRAEFMQEELDEFKQALRDHDLCGMADALIDLVYVAKGTAVELGLPWEELWQDVQRANMEKVVGQTKRGPNDVTKPPNWVGPRTWEIMTSNPSKRLRP